jgi:hypothetical protein
MKPEVALTDIFAQSDVLNNNHLPPTSVKKKKLKGLSQKRFKSRILRTLLFQSFRIARIKAKFALKSGRNCNKKFAFHLQITADPLRQLLSSSSARFVGRHSNSTFFYAWQEKVCHVASHSLLESQSSV